MSKKNTPGGPESSPRWETLEAFARAPARADQRHDHGPAAAGAGAACVGDPTFGDAILDRLVHQAHRLTLKGTSMRRRETEKTKSTDTH